MCISLHFCYILYIFVLYTVFFCCILEKIQIENISVEHHFLCQWRTLSVAHLNWVRHRYYAWRTPLRCAMDRTHNRGAYSRAPLVINTRGLICVVHHRCATKPQNGAPQIRVFLVVVALARATQYQQNLRNYHSSRVCPQSFVVGDLVLRLKQDGHGKLESPWVGPYIVTEGANRLKDKKTGKDESNPWNAEQLRWFYA
jgi:hypothetical protein